MPRFELAVAALSILLAVLLQLLRWRRCAHALTSGRSLRVATGAAATYCWTVALLLALAALMGRFAGRILGTAIDWAGQLLFGKVPDSRRLLVSLISFASLGWLVAVLGILLPDVGTYLLVAIPLPPWADRALVRLFMLGVALVVPALVGLASVYLQDPPARPAGVARALRLLRGYPFAFGLSVTLVIVGAIAALRRIRSLSRRWSESHIPIAVRPGAYEEAAAELEDAFRAAGLELVRRDAPRALDAPARFLAAIAGPDAAALIPARMTQLTGDGLEVLLYPFDIACSGRREQLARARAAVGSRLGSGAAYLTTSPAAHQLEDRLDALNRDVRRAADTPARDAGLRGVRAQLAAIETDLAVADVPYDDWETLRRIVLQIERAAQ